VHKQILTGVFLTDTAFSHFLYVEGDLELKPEGVAYWLEAGEQLAGLPPTPHDRQRITHGNAERVLNI
jgi:hypothetical protein